MSFPRILDLIWEALGLEPALPPPPSGRPLLSTFPYTGNPVLRGRVASLRGLMPPTPTPQNRRWRVEVLLGAQCSLGVTPCCPCDPWKVGWAKGRKEGRSSRWIFINKTLGLRDRSRGMGSWCPSARALQGLERQRSRGTEQGTGSRVHPFRGQRSFAEIRPTECTSLHLTVGRKE